MKASFNQQCILLHLNRQLYCTDWHCISWHSYVFRCFTM